MALSTWICVGVGAAFALMSTDVPAADRVAAARKEKEAVVRALARRAGLGYPVKRVFLRAFKRERILELWGAGGATQKMRLIKSYPIAAASGVLGPKRREGDNQVPEGFYTIDRFNPLSRFLLSLRVDYPNESDRTLSDPARPGGDIYVHGNRVSIGCLAMTDDSIKEIYLLALDAKNAGQSKVTIHIFPCRLTDEALRELISSNAARGDLVGFWKSLKPGYDAFERTRQVPAVAVRADGLYEIRTQKR